MVRAASATTGSRPTRTTACRSTPTISTSEGGFAPLPKPPPRNRCAGEAGARTARARKAGGRTAIFPDRAWPGLGGSREPLVNLQREGAEVGAGPGLDRPRARERDRNDRGDASRPRRQHDNPIGEEDRLRDRVGDEDDGLPRPAPLAPHA